MAFANFFQSGNLRRNLIPAAIAVVIGGIAWIGIGPILSGESDEPETPPHVETAPPPEPAAAEPPPPEPVYPSVLVANQNIPSGILLVAEYVEWRKWKDPFDTNMAVVDGVVPLGVVIGAVTRRAFSEGSMISWEGLLMPGHPGFISAVLNPGMLAVTVEVDRATTDANIIYPGDRVDVIMVATSNSDSFGPASRTIVRDCRVLAVGSTVLSLGRYGRVSLSQAGEVQPVPRPDGANYTLEVIPTDAERIAVASSAGRLTLAMRSIKSPAVSGGEGAPVRLREVMPAPEGPAAPVTVRIIRGADSAVDSQENL